MGMSQLVAPVALDLDGTLFEMTSDAPAPGRVFSTNQAVMRFTRPMGEACSIVAGLVDVGEWEVVYITGRPVHLGSATRRQLKIAGLPAGPLWMLPTIWSGRDACADWKASVLEVVEPSLFIGDGREDRRAAEKAGVGFQHASELQEFARWEPA